MPKLFGRWSSTRSYGPYGKSYASSSCDSDFESDNQSTQSDIPDEYWPYSEAENSEWDADYSDSDAEYSDIDTEYSNSADCESKRTDSNPDDFEDLNSINSSKIVANDMMIEMNETLIDDEFTKNEKNKV